MSAIGLQNKLLLSPLLGRSANYVENLPSGYSRNRVTHFLTPSMEESDSHDRMRSPVEICTVQGLT
jgi:hypothetical protein